METFVYKRETLHLFSSVMVFTKLTLRLGQRPSGPGCSKVDNAIHRINHYPIDSVVCFVNIYPLDNDLSGGERYPAFEQLGPGQCFPSKSRFQLYVSR